MSSIKTYTGKMFDPLDPKEDLVDIVDIAHALSMLCRANGHFRSFYSVGLHSINCMNEAKARGYSRRVQLACLLHDASEAYLSDVTRPVKEELPRYRQIEVPLQTMVWAKWLDGGLEPWETEQVFEIDDAMLVHEFLALMDTQIVEPMPELHSTPEFAFFGFDRCEQQFLCLFRQLTSNEDDCFAVGIDWMNGHWLAVELCNGAIDCRTFSHIGDVCETYADADAILIDVPIGLPQNDEEEACRPDCAARVLLGTKRKSCVFPVPCRQAVYEDGYEQACLKNLQVLGKGMSSQSHGFSKTIRQVDAFLRDHSQWKNRLMESHPEVAFQILQNGLPLQYSKKTAQGLLERKQILRSYGMDSEDILRRFPVKWHNDVLDATALALHAKLGHRDGFRTVPEVPDCDSAGLKMQMVFWDSENSFCR